MHKYKIVASHPDYDIVTTVKASCKSDAIRQFNSRNQAACIVSIWLISN